MSCLQFFLCICRYRGLMTENIHSHIIDVTFGVTFFLFLFWHDFTDCLLKILIVQCCIVKIIVINYIFQHLRIVFFFYGGHVCSFICHVKSVQRILSTIKYVKISQHFMCNWIFLILCLILCVFLFGYILWKRSNSSPSVEHSSTMMPFVSSLSVEQIWDKVSSTTKYFNPLSHVEQIFEIGICFVAVISVLTG